MYGKGELFWELQENALKCSFMIVILKRFIAFIKQALQTSF